MTAQTQIEGFHPGTVSYTTKNPGNIGNTDTGGRVSYTTLAEGIQAQQRLLLGAQNGTSKYYKLSNTLYQYLSTYAPACYRRKGDQVLVRGTNNPTEYANFIINWFKYQGYTITAETTLAQINALA